MWTVSVFPSKQSWIIRCLGTKLEVIHLNQETSLKMGCLQISCETGYLLHNKLTFAIKVILLVLLKFLSKMDIFF